MLYTFAFCQLATFDEAICQTPIIYIPAMQYYVHIVTFCANWLFELALGRKSYQVHADMN